MKPEDKDKIDKVFANMTFEELQAKLIEAGLPDYKTLHKRLTAAEAVAEAGQKLSVLYDGELDTNKPELYKTWRAMDDALQAWRKAKEGSRDE